MNKDSVRSSVLPRPSNLCPDCKGVGSIYAYGNVEDGPMVTAMYPCMLCGGAGYVEVATK